MAWKRQAEDSLPGIVEPTPAVLREKGMNAIVNIGQSVQIKGELSGNEDLTIEGQVEGKILLIDHHLTIGANARIHAEVNAKSVRVIGQVSGNITAGDRVEIAETGTVHGDIRAPRVAIADGAKFKGSIDMERKAAAPAAAPREVPREVARSAS